MHTQNLVRTSIRSQPSAKKQQGERTRVKQTTNARIPKPTMRRPSSRSQSIACAEQSLQLAAFCTKRIPPTMIFFIFFT